MKYTARHIQRFVDTGRIDATLWKNHFPSLLPTQVPTCEECGEFKDRTCAGAKQARRDLLTPCALLPPDPVSAAC